MARVNNNAYKLNLPGEYNVSVIFNVSDFLPFDFESEDSRVHPFEEGGVMHMDIRTRDLIQIL